ncbi:MAG: DUF4249 family protein [Bacteroidetes bacterium]|nr:DUF4249 family protein [Bacteroidota bacterium]
MCGCDAFQPESPSLPVVEAFVMSGQSMPEITLKRTGSIAERYQSDESTALRDAQLQLTMSDRVIPYSVKSPGKYVPVESVIAVPGADLELELQWNNQIILANDQIPGPISLDSVEISISDEPLESLVLESVFIDPTLLDSLGIQALGTGARKELVYIVEAKLYWAEQSQTNNPDDWWIRTQLRPNLDQSRRLFNYFFSPETLQLEDNFPINGKGKRYWSGAYAVSIETKTDPFPGHRLRISLVRSSQTYADFVSGSSNPREREPPTNIRGGRGIFAALAVDTLLINVYQ